MEEVYYKDGDRYYWKLEYCPTGEFHTVDDYQDPEYRFTFYRSADESNWHKVYNGVYVFGEGYKVSARDFVLLLQNYIAGVSLGWVAVASRAERH